VLLPRCLSLSSFVYRRHKATGFATARRLPSNKRHRRRLNRTIPRNSFYRSLRAGRRPWIMTRDRPSQPPMNVVSAADHTGDSDTPPPEGNRYTFVADSGGHLDGYWFRNDLPDGQLKFTIEITSPIVSQLNLDPQGFLTQAAVDDFSRRGFMSHEAELTLQVFDVDHDPNAETVCPERDYIRINGKQVTLPNEAAPAFLRSGDNQWNEWKVYFPVTYLSRTYASSIVTEGDFNC
jgi:hypothetical protein